MGFFHFCDLMHCGYSTLNLAFPCEAHKPETRQKNDDKLCHHRKNVKEYKLDIHACQILRCLYRVCFVVVHLEIFATIT